MMKEKEGKDIRRKMQEFVWCCNTKQQGGFIKVEFMEKFGRNKSVTQRFLASMVDLGYLRVERHWHRHVKTRPYVYFPNIHIAFNQDPPEHERCKHGMIKETCKFCKDK